jgi:hypothetical protein
VATGALRLRLTGVAASPDTQRSIGLLAPSTLPIGRPPFSLDYEFAASRGERERWNSSGGADVHSS